MVDDLSRWECSPSTKNFLPYLAYNSLETQIGGTEISFYDEN